MHWFNDTVQGGFLLGDPGIRDSILHGVQACMPHRTLIPVSVTRIEAGQLLSDISYRLTATEVEDRGNELIFDLTVSDEQGKVNEKWYRVVFRKFGVPKNLQFIAPVILAPFMERHIKTLLPGMDLIVKMTRGERESVKDDTNYPLYRPDGKPNPISGGNHTSNAYCQGWKLSVFSNFPVACDLEWFTDPKINNWSHLLNADRYALAQTISTMVGEDIERSAARVWTILEAIKKIGLPVYSPITLNPSSKPHCISFHTSMAHVYSVLAVPENNTVVFASLAVLPTQQKTAPKASTKANSLGI
ncbi:MAG: hypothetical protein D3910_26560 [Candidatus Electrothrix sp. ATG2]|nr:hypothetical protein [Candidatus Electrothrix sp. ATG2]